MTTDELVLMEVTWVLKSLKHKNWKQKLGNNNLDLFS